MNPLGQFLMKDPIQNVWHEIGHEKARDKTSQALRENALNVQKQTEETIQEKSRLQLQQEVQLDSGFVFRLSGQDRVVLDVNAPSPPLLLANERAVGEMGMTEMGIGMTTIRREDTTIRRDDMTLPLDDTTRQRDDTTLQSDNTMVQHCHQTIRRDDAMLTSDDTKRR